ncbi:hypothetical protein [Agrobacterium rosae]|uniref:hypothetical protein n=1 Tax=Agrobacterium rosae TaxID=1972867 RepID=UPI00122F861D|nr:hypothetical protein [Agrobacterium rosae]KAA3506214.1 hypothetical protein DXM21_25400 [Agrobacterium rosae]MQB51403.1 hypothetical protein [Agrobacterium rosae]
MYKLGDIERAFYVFSRVEELYGARGFKGEQKAISRSLGRNAENEQPAVLDPANEALLSIRLGHFGLQTAIYRVSAALG